LELIEWSSSWCLRNNFSNSNPFFSKVRADAPLHSEPYGSHHLLDGPAVVSQANGPQF
jgi:hypothetical protein